MIFDCLENKINLLLSSKVHPICREIFLKFLLKFSPVGKFKVTQVMNTLTKSEESVAKYASVWVLASSFNEDTFLSLLQNAALDVRRKTLKKFLVMSRDPIR
jgi:hypothetical protein